MIKKSQIFYAPSEEGVEIVNLQKYFHKKLRTWKMFKNNQNKFQCGFKNEYTIYKFRKWFKRAGIEESGITGSAGT